MNINLLHGDCLELLDSLPENSVDSIITDPPYGLSKAPDMTEVLTHWLNGDDYEHRGSGFMGKTWDSFVPGPSVWRRCLAVLKPGGHLLSFFGSRTYDLGTTAIRLAGFEIRDQIMWVYGSGFPKSHNLGRAIDKALGIKPTVIPYAEGDLHVPTSQDAKNWDGWGTALKPAHEPICVARKPFTGSVVQNVLKHGTGAMNINATRVGTETRYNPRSHNKPGGLSLNMSVCGMPEDGVGSLVSGRWPANFCHDGSEEVLNLFPHSTSNGNRSEASRQASVKGTSWLMDNHMSQEYSDSGSVARYFYCAKASKQDRDEGLHMMSETQTRNPHPTVKPTSLMAWLCRLVTPTGGVILDPFMGSGSTGKAAVIEDFDFIGMESDSDYFDIARQRIAFKQNQLHPS
ncbi:site-specific DNA-methyltransferase [Pantoea sp. Al-1710]|uniref:Methyltransferase n=1 Tax=Candidatus Pantoea communis TaxID=2608354 RepID=A0ABX0RJV4_9GAMM|nr:MULTISPECIES: DNA methyltransferase [Pantoea]NIG12976.1 site-specific DNA-methyltransferase [Pantoea sp. Cy-640]NIG17323.1 site-specific DNA-methyltransferase [Pantoea communis]